MNTWLSYKEPDESQTEEDITLQLTMLINWSIESFTWTVE